MSAPLWPTNVDSQTVVLCSDHQVPYHDKTLHKLFCQTLADNPPDILVVLGDLIDLPSISRFADNPDQITTVEENLSATYNVLADYRANAGSAAQIFYLPGNHEERLSKYIIKNAPALWGTLTLPSLLKLEKLEIQWVSNSFGDWPHAQLQLTKSLTATHGWIVRKNSGASALTTLEHLARSVIMGHTHRMGMVFRTQHGSNGKVSVHTGVEIGTMCNIVGGLGYAIEPNWQNGFCTLTIYRDGTFSTPRLISYIRGRLYT